MAEPLALPLHAFPPDLIEAVARNAALDAERVALFLDRFLDAQGITQAQGERPTQWPGHFLLELAAALRLLVWEGNGLLVHREAGLPPADQALRDSFGWLTGPPPPETGPPPVPLTRRVFTLSIERLAWAGPLEWGTDLALGEVDEDQLVEVLADFLWAHRHDLSLQNNTGGGTA